MMDIISNLGLLTQSGSIYSGNGPVASSVVSKVAAKDQKSLGALGIGSPTSHAMTAAATSQKTGAATSSSSITSSDFLKLLVSELKNQDPTQPTDPNAYVQQLVGVNSLQQLIQINKGLTTIEPTSSVAG